MSTPLMTQLALDLFGEQAGGEASRRREAEDAAWRDRHQVGQIRLIDTATGEQTGQLLPAWRCCACGGVSPSKYLLLINHGCCDELHWMPYCQNPPRRPYRSMDIEWIPPTAEGVAR